MGKIVSKMVGRGRAGKNTGIVVIKKRMGSKQGEWTAACYTGGECVAARGEGGLLQRWRVDCHSGGGWVAAAVGSGFPQ